MLGAILETLARLLPPFCEERGRRDKDVGSSCWRQDGINGGSVIAETESGICPRGSVRCELLEGEAHELCTAHCGNTLKVNFQVALLQNCPTLQLQSADSEWK